MDKQDLVWVTACRASEIGSQQAKRVQLGDMPVALFNLEGHFYALADRCPHGNASLSEGWIENGEVECPLHQARFAIATGQVLCAPARSCAQRFAVRVEGDWLCVALARYHLEPATAVA